MKKLAGILLCLLVANAVMAAETPPISAKRTIQAFSPGAYNLGEIDVDLLKNYVSYIGYSVIVNTFSYVVQRTVPTLNCQQNVTFMDLLGQLNTESGIQIISGTHGSGDTMFVTKIGTAPIYLLQLWFSFIETKPLALLPCSAGSSYNWP